MLIHNKGILVFGILFSSLFFQIVCQFNSSLSFLFSLLLLSNSEFIVSEFPEFWKFNLLLFLRFNFFLSSSNLILSALLNGLFHFHSSDFFLLKKCSGFIFGLSDLFVQNFFFLISNLHEFSNLFINKLLLSQLLNLESLRFFGFLEMFKSIFLCCVFYNFLFFFLLLDSDFLLNF